MVDYRDKMVFLKALPAPKSLKNVYLSLLNYRKWLAAHRRLVEEQFRLRALNARFPG